jgi:hypothetical protein
VGLSNLGHPALYGDGDGAGFEDGVGAEAGPGVVFGFCGKAGGDWVAVHVPELLDALLGGEDVEVLVAGKPKGRLRRAARDFALDGGDGFGEDFAGRFGEKKVDVFGHDDVADDVEGILFSPGFEHGFEEGFGFGGVEVGVTVLATEGDEMEVAGLLATFGFGGHGARGPGICG